jgi:hypothetical protein
LRREGVRAIARLAYASLAFVAAAAAPARAADVSHFFQAAGGGEPRGDAGMVVDGDWVRLKADVALQTQDGSTQVVPNLRSSFDLGPRVDLETRLGFADRNGGPLGTIVKTRVHYDPPAPFIESVDGTVWRSPGGQAGEALNVAFKKVIQVPDRPRPITIRGRAVVESTTAGVAADVAAVATGAESRRYSLETEVRGLVTSLMRGRSALRLKLERSAGVLVEKVESLAYDYSWTLRNVTQLGFNVGMQQRATEQTVAVVEPSVGLTWRAQF